MTNLALIAMLLILHVFALGCLALSQAKHWRKLIGPVQSPSRTHLRWLGGVGLTTSLLSAVSICGWGFGGLIWLLSLHLGGYAVAFALSLRDSAEQNQARIARSLRKS